MIINMHIEETEGDTVLRVKKSRRDKDLGKNVPRNSGLPTSSFTMSLVGSPGQGKSAAIESLMLHQYRGVWDQVHLVCPSGSRSSYDGSYMTRLNKNRIYDALTAETLKKIYDEVQEECQECDESEPPLPFNALLILDDTQAMLSGDTGVFLRHMMANHRHASLSIMITLQNYMALEKASRDLIEYCWIYKVRSHACLKRLNEELLPYLKPDEMLTLCRYIFDKPHQFSIVSRKGDGSVTKGFNPLRIETPTSF